MTVDVWVVMLAVWLGGVMFGALAHLVEEREFPLTGDQRFDTVVSTLTWPVMLPLILMGVFDD